AAIGEVVALEAVEVAAEVEAGPEGFERLAEAALATAPALGRPVGEGDGAAMGDEDVDRAPVEGGRQGGDLGGGHVGRQHAGGGGRTNRRSGGMGRGGGQSPTGG